MITLAKTLDEGALAIFQALPKKGWFHRVEFENFTPPLSWGTQLDENFDRKRELLSPWMPLLKGFRVLELFCANGGFSLFTHLHGAQHITGIEQDPRRVQVAREIYRQLDFDHDFIQGDVYEAETLVQGQTFDAVTVFGGLYHVDDPGDLLRIVSRLARKYVIIQTSRILEDAGEKAVKNPVRDQGKSDMLGPRNYHTWSYTVKAFEALLRRVPFKIIENARPAPEERDRFPWYSALLEKEQG